MPNQSAKFVSAVFAGVLAGANFIPALNNPARADDNCLAAPQGSTPQGSHWYYHIERGTKRHCWYLRGEGDAHAAQSAAAASSPAAPTPAQPAAPNPQTTMQGSVANARAELPWPQPNTAPETPAPAAQVPPATAANTPGSDGNQPPSSPAAAAGDPSTAAATSAGGTNTLQTTVASRWPDQLNTSASDDSAPAADNPEPNAQSDAVSAPPPAAPLVTAEAPSSGKQPGSMQMLFTIMIVTLALAGLVGGAILRFGGRKRRRDDEEFDTDHGPIWDQRSDRALPYPAAAGPRPNIGLPRELRRVEPDDAIKEMLTRLARSAQT